MGATLRGSSYSEPEMRLGVVLFIIAVTVIAGAYVPARHRRWPVKVLMDADASRVDLGPTATTVSALSSLQTPVTWLLGGPANHRLEQTEFHTYEVQAFMTGLKLQPDGDYHIVIADSADQAKVMIVEIPDPRENPTLGSKFAEARSAVDQHLFRPTQVMRWIQPRRVKVTGVGFFDRLTDDQDGPAANGIELHPVLKITFE